MRKTGFAKELEDLQFNVHATENTVKATYAAGRIVRKSRKHLRKALTRFCLAEREAATLPKEVSEYRPKSTGRRHGRHSYGPAKYARTEVAEWHSASEHLTSARERYAETVQDYQTRHETRRQARHELAYLKAKVEEVIPFVDREITRKSEKAAKDAAKAAARKPKTLEDTWRQVGEGEYVPVKPINAWVRTFTGKVKVHVDAYRENGCYILKHAGGMLRLKVQTPHACDDLRYDIVALS